MAQDVAQRVVRNAAFIFGGRLWFLGLSLLLTPYLLSRLGAELFGVWVLIDALVRTIGLMDLGFGTSFVKHVAEYDARGDREGVSGVFSAGMVFYAAVALSIILVAFFGMGSILAFFTIPAGLKESTRAVFVVAIAASLSANFLGVYHSIMNGLQRMGLTNGIMVLISGCYAAGCVIALESGYGIVGLAVNQLLSQWIGIVVSVFAARRVYPGLKFRLENLRRHVSTLFQYGFNLHVSNIAALVNFYMDKLLVNRFIDASHVAFYEIGSKPPATARSFAVLILSALTPATSEIEVREGRERLYQVFCKVSRFVSVLAFPLFIGAVVISGPLVEAWVGGGYGLSVTAMRVLSVGYLFYSFAGPVTPLVQGMGRPQVQRNAETLSLMLNIVLSVILISRFGFNGAAAGTAIAIAISATYYLSAFHRLMGRPLLPFVAGTYLKPAACALLAAVVGGLLVSVLAPRASGDRLLSLGVVVAVGAIFAGVYSVLILKWGYLEKEDVGMIRRYLSIRRLVR